MSRDDAVYVGHMLDTARKAVEKIDRTNRAAFDSDENLRLAVAYFDVGYPLGLPGDRLLAAEMRLLTLASFLTPRDFSFPVYAQG